MSVSHVIIVNVPSVNIARKEVGVGNSSDASVEFEITRADVAPARIVLEISIVLAAHLKGVPAANERKDIGVVVHSLAQNGIDVTVCAASSAQSEASSIHSGINGDLGKDVARSIGAVSWLQAQRGGIVLTIGERTVRIKLVHSTRPKLVQHRRANRIDIRNLAGQIPVMRL